MALVVDGKLSAPVAPYRATACKGRDFLAGWPNVGLGSFGAIDEIRLSRIVRKPAVQKQPYATDKNTLLLLHFDGEPGDPAVDSSKTNKAP